MLGGVRGARPPARGIGSYFYLNGVYDDDDDDDVLLDCSTSREEHHEKRRVAGQDTAVSHR